MCIYKYTIDVYKHSIYKQYRIHIEFIQNKLGKMHFISFFYFSIQFYFFFFNDNNNNYFL